MRVHQPSLVSHHFGEALLELDLSVLRGFNFRSGQREPGLIPLQQIVIVGGMPVIAENLGS